MNKKLFVFLLLALSFSFLGACDEEDRLYSVRESHREFLSTERTHRRYLYWWEKYNPHYTKVEGFQFDYSIAVLTDHIKLLENKIVNKQNGLKSNAMLCGVIISIFSTIWGYAAYRQLCKGIEITKNNPLGSLSAHDEMLSAFFLVGFATILVGIAGQQFYKVLRYQQRFIERLERDKRILAHVEKEKAVRNSDLKNITAAAIKLINIAASSMDAAQE